MRSKLSSYKLKIGYNIYKIYKPHGNHKAKTYSICTKDEEKGNTAYHNGKIICSQKKTAIEEKKETRQLKKPENNY